jgi:hypothetical protein
MKSRVGVDLQQRFCYLTAVDAGGKLVGQGPVVNEAAALRAWLRLRKPAQVARIALERKLLTVLWALLHHGVCFDREWFARG